MRSSSTSTGSSPNAAATWRRWTTAPARSAASAGQLGLRVGPRAPSTRGPWSSSRLDGLLVADVQPPEPIVGAPGRRPAARRWRPGCGPGGRPGERAGTSSTGSSRRQLRDEEAASRRSRGGHRSAPRRERRSAGRPGLVRRGRPGARSRPHRPRRRPPLFAAGARLARRACAAAPPPRTSCGPSSTGGPNAISRPRSNGAITTRSSDGFSSPPSADHTSDRARSSGGGRAQVYGIG